MDGTAKRIHDFEAPIQRTNISYINKIQIHPESSKQSLIFHGKNHIPITSKAVPGDHTKRLPATAEAL
jgi:hypothetical protein